MVGGDSAIAAATLTAMRRDGLRVIATTRRRDGCGPGRVFLDITRPFDDWRPPEGITAACICAAVANLVDCARDPVGSEAVNVTGAIALIELLAARGIYGLFLSTDKVFDGSRAQIPTTAPLSPHSVYGGQKARTDAHLQAMIAASAPVGILRLARVVPPGWPLLKQWREELGAGRSIRSAI